MKVTVWLLLLLNLVPKSQLHSQYSSQDLGIMFLQDVLFKREVIGQLIGILILILVAHNILTVLWKLILIPHVLTGVLVE